MLFKNSRKVAQDFLLIVTFGSVISMASGCSNDKGNIDDGSSAQNVQGQQATTGPTPPVSCLKVQELGETKPTAVPGYNLTWPVDRCIHTRYPGFTKSCHKIYDSNGTKFVFNTETGAQIGNGLIQSHNVLTGNCRPEK